MENLSEAHGRSTEQIQPLENLRKEGYGEWQRRSVRSQSDSTSSSLMRDTLSLRLPLFYSSRREAVSPVYITFILCPFGQRYSSIFPTEYCYLGLDFCTYLSTIQQRACPRVRAGSRTLYMVCACGRFSSRQRITMSHLLFIILTTLYSFLKSHRRIAWYCWSFQRV